MLADLSFYIFYSIFFKKENYALPSLSHLKPPSCTIMIMIISSEVLPYAMNMVIMKYNYEIAIVATNN